MLGDLELESEVQSLQDGPSYFGSLAEGPRILWARVILAIGLDR